MWNKFQLSSLSNNSFNSILKIYNIYTFLKNTKIKKTPTTSMKTSMITILVTFFAVLFVASMAGKISPEEACIRRTLALSQPQPPSSSGAEPKRTKFDYLADQFCRDTSRAVMFYVRLNRKFPSHYVKTLCKVFLNDQKKVMEYIVTRWIGSSKLASSLTCVSHWQFLLRLNRN